MGKNVARIDPRKLASVAFLGFGAVLLMRFMTAMLFGVAPDDPVTLSAAAVLMFVVAVAASWIPAGSAAAVAPADVLRMDA